MNLFQKYGIKEVADVTFYSINAIGDEIIYTPVLYLDTLKISTIEKTAEKVSAQGGKGNKKLVSWNYGKEFSLNLEDALFTPASMSMIWGGKLNSKLSIYTSTIAKSNIANKYGALHYSIKAYPSPALSEDEWNLVFKAATETQTAVAGKVGDSTQWYVITPAAMADEEKKAYILENQVLLKKAYLNRTWVVGQQTNIAMPQTIITKILEYIDDIKKLGTIETSMSDIEVIDRMEKVIVRDKNGLEISTEEQKNNLLRYYADDKNSSYCIYYDEKTMLPLFHIENGQIDGWNSAEDVVFKLRLGQKCLKWTRTVKYKNSDLNTTLGQVLVIDADTFPGDYKIVGETYIREQKTGKDQRYQFTINRAQVSTDTSITLQADGDPTTFSMKIDVLEPQNGELVDFKQFNVEQDEIRGGTMVAPQKAQYTHTNTEKVSDTVNVDDINNGEIY